MSWRRQLANTALRSLSGGASPSTGASVSSSCSAASWLQACKISSVEAGASCSTSSSGAATHSSLTARRLAHHHACSRTQLQLARRFSSEPQQTSSGGHSSGRASPITFRSMFITLFAGAGVVAAARHFESQKTQELAAKTQAVVGKASVGGPFALVDHNKRPFTHLDLPGEFSMLYFGFTHCPDICPDELEKLAEAVDLVEESTGSSVLPVFISVDPARDTPERVRQYVREFHPRLLGLTGEEDAVKSMTKAYRVYFHKSGEGGSPNDYLVDHSIIMYLLDPEGEFVTFYGKNFNAQQLADSIAGHIREWEAGHPEYRAKAAEVAKQRAEALAAAEKEGSSSTTTGSSSSSSSGRRWYWPFGKRDSKEAGRAVA